MVGIFGVIGCGVRVLCRFGWMVWLMLCRIRLWWFVLWVVFVMRCRCGCLVKVVFGLYFWGGIGGCGVGVSF